MCTHAHAHAHVRSVLSSCTLKSFISLSSSVWPAVQNASGQVARHNTHPGWGHRDAQDQGARRLWLPDSYTVTLVLRPHVVGGLRSSVTWTWAPPHDAITPRAHVLVTSPWMLAPQQKGWGSTSTQRMVHLTPASCHFRRQILNSPGIFDVLTFSSLFILTVVRDGLCLSSTILPMSCT